jgi:hypothetical protein
MPLEMPLDADAIMARMGREATAGPMGPGEPYAVDTNILGALEACSDPAALAQYAGQVGSALIVAERLKTGRVNPN